MKAQVNPRGVNPALNVSKTQLLELSRAQTLPTISNTPLVTEPGHVETVTTNAASTDTSVQQGNSTIATHELFPLSNKNLPSLVSLSEHSSVYQWVTAEDTATDDLAVVDSIRSAASTSVTTTEAASTARDSVESSVPGLASTAPLSRGKFVFSVPPELVIINNTAPQYSCNDTSIDTLKIFIFYKRKTNLFPFYVFFSARFCRFYSL